MCRATVLLAVHALVPLTSVIAQEPPPQMEPGKRVRISYSCPRVLSGDCVSTGTLVRLDADSVVLMAGGEC